MPDVLIRDIPADDLARLDEQARALGLSRAAYLRRQLLREANRSTRAVTVADLSFIDDLLPDLAEPDVMDDAWS